MTLTQKSREKAGHTRAVPRVADVAPPVVEAAPSTQELRERAGYSQLRAAALANVGLATWRVFEIDPTKLRRKSRARCEQAMATIRLASEAA